MPSPSSSSQSTSASKVNKSAAPGPSASKKSTPRRRRQSPKTNGRSSNGHRLLRGGQQQYLSSPQGGRLQGQGQGAQYSSQLTSNPEFLGNRSPFFQTISRHCVMPICQKQLIHFQFNLPAHWVDDIQQSFKRFKSKPATTSTATAQPATTNNSDGSSTRRLLHIRLFDLKGARHVEWEPEVFVLKINNEEVVVPPLPAPKKKAKRKKAALRPFRFVQPLDISGHAMNEMTFEIACYRPVFHGAASIEIVNLLSVKQIAMRVQGASLLASTLQQITDSDSAPAQQCKICGLRDNLSRCSRCKATWYCSKAHQEADWKEHCLGCQPFDDLARLRLQHRDPRRSEASDDIVCDEMKISIRDPLSLRRIEVPVRGTGCRHPQCVDLETYLEYSHCTKQWQCPICMMPLRYRDCAVDHSMAAILAELADDVEQVRLNPDDYSYRVVTLEEMQREDGMEQNGARTQHSRKRRLDDITTLSDDDDDDDGRSTEGQSRKRRRSKPPHGKKKRKADGGPVVDDNHSLSRATKQIEVIVLD